MVTLARPDWRWMGVRFGLAAGLGVALRPRHLTDLRGQGAVIMGGSRGLGLLLARELVREGCGPRAAAGS